MYRLFFLLIALGCPLAVPAAAQDKIGERTTSAQELLADVGAGVSDAELERAIAAAAAHPLGSVQNPVRVGGPDGAQAYVGRLRCADGSKPRLGERTSGAVGGFGTIVDIFPLHCGPAASGRFDLAIDMYHEGHEEQRPPAGFITAR